MIPKKAHRKKINHSLPKNPSCPADQEVNLIKRLAKGLAKAVRNLLLKLLQHLRPHHNHRPPHLWSRWHTKPQVGRARVEKGAWVISNPISILESRVMKNVRGMTFQPRWWRIRCQTCRNGRAGWSKWYGMDSSTLKAEGSHSKRCSHLFTARSQTCYLDCLLIQNVLVLIREGQMSWANHYGLANVIKRNGNRKQRLPASSLLGHQHPQCLQ